MKVEGKSMQPTFQENDRAFMLKNPYKISKGDIIVFQQGNEKMIKRVIATENDYVQINENQVIVNGEIIDEEYLISYPEDVNFEYQDEKVESIVPKNTVFVLGDNQLNSLDSRILGFIDQKDILWRVVFAFLLRRV
jgi:signal peptidase I